MAKTWIIYWLLSTHWIHPSPTHQSLSSRLMIKLTALMFFAWVILILLKNGLKSQEPWCLNFFLKISLYLLCYGLLYSVSSCSQFITETCSHHSCIGKSVVSSGFGTICGCRHYWGLGMYHPRMRRGWCQFLKQELK